MEVLHQDKNIIIVDDYENTTYPDGVFFKVFDARWMESPVAGLYRALFNRNKSLIQIRNEWYGSRYAAIEPSLTGNVLILGLGLAHLDDYLTTGTSWVWVENNQWLVDNVIPVNGTVIQADAENLELMVDAGAASGGYDTILVDFAETQINDYSSLLAFGGTVIKMQI